MKPYSSLILLLLFLYPVIDNPVFADTYPGWKKSIDNQGAITYKAESGSNALVKIYPPVLLENIGPEVWLRNKLTNSQAPRGKWSNNEMNIARQTANLATGYREFTQPDGTVGVLSGFAYTADRQYVRLGVYIGSLNDSGSALKEGVKILGQLPKIEEETALEEQRGIDKEKSPPKVKGITTGNIKIKPGRYVGTKKRGAKVVDRYELVLYENGQYEFLGSDDHGDYVFSEATGRLNIEGDFSNSTYSPHEDFCIYGIDDRSKKPVIYVRDGGYATYRLLWVDAPDRLSPREREQLDKLAKEEADRYKHVTNPGDGLQLEDIEAVVYTSELETGLGTSLKAEAYVLMKDGRVMDSMPVAPNVLDVAKSRSRDPDRWGYWKVENKSFVFAWSVDQQKFVAPSGKQQVAQAIPRGTRLEGTWGMGKSYALLDYSSVSQWGVKLTKDGRFEEYKSHSALSGGESTGMGGGPMVGTFSDEEGGQSLIIGTNIGGGAKTTKDNPKSHYQGSYEFDDYNLTLKYDNGKVERLLTFSVGDNFDTIWFNNSILARKDK